ncbi:helix-turn-helix domain-containing protein [Melghirimyces algeriensis]|uniref:Helix-turn-helix n=1 Tax=Melghirimyces algeriensis TaxID=910412 RepID=A0A521AFD5_9BACL|nr:helix-turn-helix transcriptional regulator [Melghirimyces algeriensis]SMO33496.1 Helix-turn-helix [Melghirimyces algeriensis]
MNTLGKRLRNLRLKKKLRQDDVAREFGVSKSAIGMYERNEREPPLTLLRQMADYFQVTTDYLLGRKQQGSIQYSRIDGEADDPDCNGNLKAFLTRNDLHWDCVPLNREELTAIQSLMEVVVRERSAKYEAANSSSKRKKRIPSNPEQT